MAKIVDADHDLARRLADPLATGSLVELQAGDIDAALAHTSRLLQGDQRIFEAGFRAAGALAFADLLMPLQEGSSRRWAMVEVKSSTSVKPYFLDDVAIQSRIALAAGVDLARVAVAHVDATDIKTTSSGLIFVISRNGTFAPRRVEFLRSHVTTKVSP